MLGESTGARMVSLSIIILLKNEDIKPDQNNETMCTSYRKHECTKVKRIGKRSLVKPAVNWVDKPGWGVD